MKRAGYLKRNVEKARAWLNNRKPLERKTPIKKVNRKRKAKRYAHQFGAKSEWLREVQAVCPVSGRTNGLECAHVGRTEGRGHRRSAGAGNERILMLHWLVHRDYDDFSISDKDFSSRWPGWSRFKIDERARHWELAWRRECER